MTPYVFNEDDLHYEYPEKYEVKVGLADDVDLTSMGIEVKDLTMDDEYSDYHTGVDRYSFDSFEASDGIEYNYAHYEAKNSSGDPADTLIVYLHGLNEGGTDNTDAKLMAQLQNTAIFLGDDFQNAMGGASILMPQCPTYWMNQMPDYGEMEFAVINPYIQSWYTGSLHELITAYKAQCGASRVVIAGFSNGGFMSLMLALTYETEYDGYVCLSEAMWDKSMTDEHITNLAKLPIYFVYCNADNTAPPADYGASTASRIAAKKPKRLHVAALDSILDISNTYYNADGTQYRFDDHQTEIYFFRNGVTCGSCGLSLWEFMAKVGR